MTYARLAALLLLSLLGAALPSTALAVGPNQERDGRALYDHRTSPRNLNRIAEPPAARDDAAARLRKELGIGTDTFAGGRAGRRRTPLTPTP